MDARAFEQFEVSGEQVQVALEGFGDLQPQVHALWAAEGLGEAVAERWLPLEGVLRALARAGAQLGEAALQRAGAAVMARAPWPDGLTTLEGLSGYLASGAPLQHRRRGGAGQPEGSDAGGPGQYRMRRLGMGLLELVSDTPYPCAFEQGLLEGALLRLGGRAALVHDSGRGCRAQGGERCTYLLRASQFRLLRRSA